jgi:hypothetical protein
MRINWLILVDDAGAMFIKAWLFEALHVPISGCVYMALPQQQLRDNDI